MTILTQKNHDIFTAYTVPIKLCVEAECNEKCEGWGARDGGFCLEDDTCACYANVDWFKHFLKIKLKTSKGFNLLTWKFKGFFSHGFLKWIKNSNCQNQKQYFLN